MKIIVLLLIANFAGCATSYRNSFDVVQVNKDTFNVITSGNGFTSQRTISDYWRRRCAELALDNGFSYFSIINKDQGNDQGYTIVNGQPMVIDKFSTEGVIKLYKEGSQPEAAYDASILIKQYDPDYHKYIKGSDGVFGRTLKKAKN